jgi:lysozyme
VAELKAGGAAFDLIKRFESLKLKAYRCPAGVWTIGWGHTGSPGHPVEAGDRITEEAAGELLAADVARVELDLPKVVGVPLNQNQWDALVSLCFNLRGGALGLPRIAPRLFAKLNSGDYAGASREMLDIDRANGKVLPGLARRRAAERELFVSEV